MILWCGDVHRSHEKYLGVSRFISVKLCYAIKKYVQAFSIFSDKKWASMYSVERRSVWKMAFGMHICSDRHSRVAFPWPLREICTIPSLTISGSSGIIVRLVPTPATSPHTLTHTRPFLFSSWFSDMAVLGSQSDFIYERGNTRKSMTLPQTGVGSSCLLRGCLRSKREPYTVERSPG